MLESIGSRADVIVDEAPSPTNPLVSCPPKAVDAQAAPQQPLPPAGHAKSRKSRRETFGRGEHSANRPYSAFSESGNSTFEYSTRDMIQAMLEADAERIGNVAGSTNDNSLRSQPPGQQSQRDSTATGSSPLGGACAGQFNALSDKATQALSVALYNRAHDFAHVQPSALRAVLALCAHLKDTHVDLSSVLSQTPTVLEDLTMIVHMWAVAKREQVELGSVYSDGCQVRHVPPSECEAATVAAPEHFALGSDEAIRSHCCRSVANGKYDGVPLRTHGLNAMLNAAAGTKLDNTVRESLLELVSQLMAVVVERLGLSQAAPTGRTTIRQQTHLPAAHWAIRTERRHSGGVDDFLSVLFVLRVMRCVPLRGISGITSQGNTDTAETLTLNVSPFVQMRPSTREVVICGQTLKYWDLVHVDKSMFVDSVVTYPKITVGNVERLLGDAMIAITLEAARAQDGSIPADHPDATATVGDPVNRILAECSNSKDVLFCRSLLDALVDGTVRARRYRPTLADYHKHVPTPEEPARFSTSRRADEPPVVAVLLGANGRRLSAPTEAFSHMKSRRHGGGGGGTSTADTSRLDPQQSGGRGDASDGHSAGNNDSTEEAGSPISYADFTAPLPTLMSTAPAPVFSSMEYRTLPPRGPRQAAGAYDRPRGTLPVLIASESSGVSGPAVAMTSTAMSPSSPAAACPTSSHTTAEVTDALTQMLLGGLPEDNLLHSLTHAPEGTCFPQMGRHLLLLVDGVPLLNREQPIMEAILNHSTKFPRLREFLDESQNYAARMYLRRQGNDRTADAIALSQLEAHFSEGPKSVGQIPFWLKTHQLQVLVLESPMARESLEPFVRCGCQFGQADASPVWHTWPPTPSFRQPVDVSTGARGHALANDGDDESDAATSNSSGNCSEPDEYRVDGWSQPSCVGDYERAMMGDNDVLYSMSDVLTRSGGARRGDGSAINAHRPSVLFPAALRAVSECSSLAMTYGDAPHWSTCNALHAFSFVRRNRKGPIDVVLGLLCELSAILRWEGVEIPTNSGDQRRMSASLMSDIATLTPALKFSPLLMYIAPELYVRGSLRGHIATHALWNYPHIFTFDMRVAVLHSILSKRVLPCKALTQAGAKAADGSRPAMAASVSFRADNVIPGRGYDSRDNLYVPRTGVPALLAHMANQGSVYFNLELLGMQWPVNPSSSIAVSRDQLLGTGCTYLRRVADAPQPLGFHFEGEVGIGIGPTLEFYELLANALANVTPAIWRRVEVEVTTPEDAAGAGAAGSLPASRFAFVRDELLYPCAPLYGADAAYYYETLGILVGLLLTLGRTTSLRFHPFFLRALLGEKLYTHRASMRRRMRMLDCKLEDTLERLESMSAEELQAAEIENELPDMGSSLRQRFFLSADGTPKTLTRRTVRSFTFAVRHYYLHDVLVNCVQHFRVGLTCFVEPHLLRLFDADELSVLISGPRGKIWETPAAFAKDVVAAHGYHTHSRIVQALIHLIPEWSTEDQRKFLQFVTGASTLPLRGLPFPIKVVCRNPTGGGGGEDTTAGAFSPDVSTSASPNTATPVQGGTRPGERTHTTPSTGVNPSFWSNWTSQSLTAYQVEVDGMLPTVGTCFHYLKLPEYSSQAVLEERLRFAIRESAGSYGLT